MKSSLARHLPRRRGRGQAGQTMVLGALLLVVVVFSMLMTFNIGNAVHERIRIQQAVDAKAYSTAVIQARAFNFFAYTNRAIAASYVAMTTAHAYHSATTLVASFYFSTFISLLVNSGAEVGHACSCQPYCCNILGWVHVGQVLAAAFSFLGRMSSRINQLKDLESPFRNWMQALEAMPPYYTLFQRGIKLWTGDVLSVGLTGTLNSLNDANAKGMGNSAALLMAENGKYFLDGNPFSVFSTNDTDKRSVMKEIANGSRWGGSPESGRCNFIANRNSGNICAVANLALYLPAMQKIWDAIPICSGTPEMMLTPALTHGATVLRNNGGDGWGVDSGGSSSRIRKAQNRNSISGADALIPFGIFTVCIHFPWIGVSPMPGWADLRSDESGSGTHSFFLGMGGNPHSGNHRWGGIKTDFMEFKPKSEPADNIGNTTLEPAIDNQPNAYASSSWDLRKVGMANGNFQRSKGWEINATGQVSVAGAQLQLTPRSDAQAMGKAMAYYHRLGNWKDYPNFWFPYWRAKLHPFTAAEAGRIATEVGGPGAGTAAAAAALAIGEN